jgi:hypothetical protein
MTVIGQKGNGIQGVPVLATAQTEFNSVGIPGLHFHGISAEAVITLVFAFRVRAAPWPSAAFSEDYFPPGG